MKENEDKRKIKKIFEAKRARRQKLANLSIEEKVEILVKLQKLAVPILVSRGLKRKAWEI